MNQLHVPVFSFYSIQLLLNLKVEMGKLLFVTTKLLGDWKETQFRTCSVTSAHSHKASLEDKVLHSENEASDIACCGMLKL